MSVFQKAVRAKAKLRLGLSGASGSGKTMGALLVAYGITGDWEKIAVIDTEHASASLYANYSQNDIEIGEFLTAIIQPPYEPEKYISMIKEAERSGAEVIIIDSLSHAWSGDGGLLDRKGKLDDKPNANTWTSWRTITPVHNRLVSSILDSKCHIIATTRAKQDYVQEKDASGKIIIRKVGMSPIQRDGMEYEFTTFIDIDSFHNASTSKDRTSLLDGKVFRLDAETGRQLKEWLENGVDIVQDSPYASIAQAKRMFAIAAGIVPKEKVEEVVKMAINAFEIESTKKIPKEKYEYICKHLEELCNIMAVPEPEEVPITQSLSEVS